MDHSANRLRLHAAAGVFTSIFALFFVAANLPYEYVCQQEYWVGGAGNTEEFAQFSTVQTPIMAGWPFRYSVRYRVSGQVESRLWSWPRLTGNVALGLTISFAIYGLTVLRHRLIGAASRPARAKLLGDGMIAVAILAVPLGVWGGHAWRAERERQLAARIAVRGECLFACWLPRPLAEHVPPPIVRTLARIRIVRLSRPSNQLAAEVAAIPTLVGLYLGSDPFNASELAPLKSRVHLSGVIVRQRELSDAMLEELAGCRWLLQLDLAGTDLDGQKLRALDSLNGLRWVNLSGTPLRLADLGRPEWSRRVRRLRLSRPQAGRSDRLTLDQWQQLEELSVRRNSVRLNAQPLVLELLRLPNLRTVYLNRVQKVSLRAEELPKLGQLTSVEDVDSLMAAVQVNGGIPSLPWFSNVVLKAVPRLARLRCFARDLQQLTIRDCRSLESLRLSSFTLQSDGFVRLEDLDPEQCQSWIDELGRGSGPRTVSLAGLPMSKVDLSPLRNNPRIRRMAFSLSDVEFDQIRRAARGGQFEELQLGDCRLDSDDLRWLLNVSPRLKRLQADLSGVTELEIVAKPGITQLQTEPIAHADTVRLIDVPNLYTPIHLVDAPDRIEVRNAPALRGLTVERPWPAEWSLSGVRRLRTFVAGGPQADDELFAALRDCRNLDRLTFAYASLSEESLAAIGRFTSLSVLELPGCELTDAATGRWRRLNHLRRVNLDDTEIGKATLDWLATLDGLRHLSISRVDLDESACEALTTLTQLVSLRVEDSAVPAKFLRELLAAGRLEELTLSTKQLDGQLIDGLARCPTLRVLDLRGPKPTAEQLGQFKRAAGRLRLKFPSEAGQRAAPGKRSGEPQNEPGRSVMPAMYVFDEMGVATAETGLQIRNTDGEPVGRSPANGDPEIDLKRFRRPRKDPTSPQ